MKFEKNVQRTKTYLQWLGLSNHESDFLEIKLNPLVYGLNNVFLIIFVVTLSVETGLALITGNDIFEFTSLFPCSIFSLMSVFKSLTVFYHMNDINLLINNVRMFQLRHYDRDQAGKDIIETHETILINIFRKSLQLIIFGAVMNDLSPIILLITHYLKTNKVSLTLPFAAYYPFDEYNPVIYPFVYLQQLVSGQVSRESVYTPDCLFFMLCSYIHIEFLMLQYDIKNLIPDDPDQNSADALFNLKYVEIVKRHQELIDCATLLEKIYSKIIWLNVTTSSIIICVTGFNAMFIDDIDIIFYYTSFMVHTIGQIFLVCYYGDNIMKSSSEIGDAVYQSLWYNIGAKGRKCLLIILTRAQRACILTAYGFIVIDLRAFSKVLSTSWSYFALLRTVISNRE